MPIPIGFNPASPLTLYERIQAVKEERNLDFVLISEIAIAAITGLGLLYAGYTAFGVAALGTAAVWTHAQKNKLKQHDSPVDLLEFALNNTRYYLLKQVCKRSDFADRFLSHPFNIPKMFSSRSTEEHFTGFQVLCRIPEFRQIMHVTFSKDRPTFIQSAVDALIDVRSESLGFNLPSQIRQRQVAVFKELIDAGFLQYLNNISAEYQLPPEVAVNSPPGELELRKQLLKSVLQEATNT